MRRQTSEYVSKFLGKHKVEKVLEVGSRDVNGSIRCLFEDITYLGVDMIKGPNVDIVVNGHNLRTVFDPDYFDAVFCFDTFEHDDAFWLTLEQMKAVLKPGGWLVLGFPGRNCPEHDHPHDYWRFMPQCASVMMKDMKKISTEADENNVFCCGQK